MENECLLNSDQNISEELLNSVKNQVIMKIMAYIHMPIDSSQAISLYANTVDGVQRINNSHLNKDGSDNNNPMNYGNTYEEQEVNEFNRAAILHNCNLRAERTDNLSKMDDLLEQLKKYANLHDQHSDIIIFDNDTGEVFATAQLKHTKDTTILTKKAYTTSKEAPEFIIVPPDTADAHASNLQARVEHGRSEDVRHRAQVALEKLTGGLVDSQYTEKIDDNHEALNDTFSLYGQLHKLAQGNPAIAKKIPYVNQAGTAAADAVTNIGNTMISRMGTIVLGGVLYELNDSFVNKNTLSWSERISRFLESVFSYLKNSIKNSIVKEIVNAVLGLIAGIFKNAAKLITTFATAIHQICGHIYDYITGKIKNFSDLVAVVLKALALAGIATLCTIFEKFVATNFPFIPELLVLLLSAAIGGIAMVFASKAIDAVVYSFVRIASKAEAAKIRREQIEKYITDLLPGMLEESDKLDKYVKEYTDKQELILTKSYPELAESFSNDNCSAVEFVSQINKLQENIGVEKIPDDFVEKTHNRLLRDSDIMHGRL